MVEPTERKEQRGAAATVHAVMNGQSAGRGGISQPVGVCVNTNLVLRLQAMATLTVTRRKGLPVIQHEPRRGSGVN